MQLIKDTPYQIKDFLGLVCICLLLCLSSCRLYYYEKSKQDLSDCINGVKMPADEFCVKWNNHYFKHYARVENKLRRLRRSNHSKRYESFKSRILEIDKKHSHIKGLSDDGEL